MRAGLFTFVCLLPLLGCASAPFQDSSPADRPPAELCNTPGRKALSHSIGDRGGLVLVDGKQWDDSVEAATKRDMGPPLAYVIMPTDRFSDPQVAEAKDVFPEARVIAPPTLEDFESDRRAYLGWSASEAVPLPAE